MVTGLPDIQSIDEAYRAGACGYLVKPFVVLQCVATLYPWLRLVQARPAHPASGPWAARWSLLTEREREILRLMGGRQHMRNKEIADRRKVKQCTIGWEIAVIYAKLNVHSRSEAIEYLYRNEGWDETAG